MAHMPARKTSLTFCNLEKEDQKNQNLPLVYVKLLEAEMAGSIEANIGKKSINQRKRWTGCSGSGQTAVRKPLMPFSIF